MVRGKRCLILGVGKGLIGFWFGKDYEVFDVRSAKENNESDFLNLKHDVALETPIIQNTKRIANQSFLNMSFVR